MDKKLEIYILQEESAKCKANLYSERHSESFHSPQISLYVWSFKLSFCHSRSGMANKGHASH